MSIRLGPDIIAGGGQTRYIQQPSNTVVLTVVSGGLVRSNAGVFYYNVSGGNLTLTQTTSFAGSSWQLAAGGAVSLSNDNIGNIVTDLTFNTSTEVFTEEKKTIVGGHNIDIVVDNNNITISDNSSTSGGTPDTPVNPPDGHFVVYYRSNNTDITGYESFENTHDGSFTVANTADSFTGNFGWSTGDTFLYIEIPTSWTVNPGFSSGGGTFEVIPDNVDNYSDYTGSGRRIYKFSGHNRAVTLTITK